MITRDVSLVKIIKSIIFTVVPFIATFIIYTNVDMVNHPNQFTLFLKFALVVIISTSLLVREYQLALFTVYLLIATTSLLVSDFTQIPFAMFTAHLALILAGWANFCAYVKRISKGGKIKDWSPEGVGGLLNYWIATIVTFTLFVHII